MTNNELIDVLKNKKDEEFIKIIRHFKNRIKQIEKKEKLDAIDKKFKEKGIQCPNCKSYWCVKNGFKNNKQKYLCKDCKSSFDALRNHFFTLKSFISWTMRLNNLIVIVGSICLYYFSIC
ncbi:IS1/IS1595 family N-terminal zinc-binding domain-containing protein [Spiroplasma endosymbiont of Zeiraphera isertana]|uniref:IS1/IS1595 family N-terminal zinc-binding domain-containing protein n=1 Tax=Spiroplasma endosymbiont of Zeiraphera isertana TaxID=3066313 RepID=UPI00313DB2DD